ncbi:MAG: AAA family ATPase [Dehalococcoidales bacterium]|nr:AAA family ATPase [Dehalococcoidales bacterium]
MEPDSIDINEKFRQSLDTLEYSTSSVFITGRAGTGKSTLLEYFIKKTGKNVAVLAPTGVAALNVKGQTIHSFFKFKPGITPARVRKYRSPKTVEIYRKLDTIIIDEISMVRADLLDCVDRFLRLNGPDESLPFGGIQMVFIGDLYQLPPVVTSTEREVFKSLYKTPYFYGAQVFATFSMDYIELDKVYRQSDQDFIDLLNSIRNNTINDNGLEILNSRYEPDFEPPPDEMYIYLTTTNKLAEQINTGRLLSLDSAPRKFTGKIEGEFNKEYIPNSIDLRLKEGSQVMMLNNDGEGRWVNGSIGKITGFASGYSEHDIIIVELTGGEEVEVSPYTWEIFRFYVDGSNLQSEVVGKFTQYPLMLAWAVTIHKSQGKTFEKVIIDVGRGTFTHGQMYVALSRCTTLEGIILKKPALKQHIWTNYQVMEFITRFQYRKAEESISEDERVAIIRKAIETQTPLEMVYLKPNDEKSERTVMPYVVGTMGFMGKTYLGMQAYCLKRKEMRTFRVDRILELK